MLYWFLGIGVLAMAGIGLQVMFLSRLRALQTATRTIAEHWADESDGGSLHDELRVLLRRLGNVIADLEAIVPNLRKATRRMNDAAEAVQEVAEEADGNG